MAVLWGGLFFGGFYMALPIYHPNHEVMVSTSALSVATGIAGVLRAPFKGTIKEVGVMIGSVVATADATVTTSIAGTAITGGAFVVTQSGSAIGDLAAASVSGTTANGVAAKTTITGANTCLEGDVIKFLWSGSGTAGGHVHCYAVVTKAN